MSVGGERQSELAVLAEDVAVMVGRGGTRIKSDAEDERRWYRTSANG